MPEMVLSLSFLLLCRSQFPSAPRYCRKTQILVSLYLSQSVAEVPSVVGTGVLLQRFNYTSVPV
jgi:hypothetical protein